MSKERTEAMRKAGVLAGFVADAYENGLPEPYLRLLDEVATSALERAREVE